MKAVADEDKPVAVPKAKQTGETQSRWSWVERAVGTERMLKALETGVKGGVWFSLIDKVYSLGNLRAAFARVKANRGSAGVDQITVGHFEKRLEANLRKLHRDLKEGGYRPQRIRRRYLKKPGRRETRPLGIPTVRDRVVQAAVRQGIEPIFEKIFAGNSYGFRPGRGCKDALRRVMQHLRSGKYWVVDADIRSYFDRIDHQQLMSEIGRQIADGGVLQLIESFLHQEVLEEMKSWRPEKGCPQGAVISPLLANIYLNPLDHQMRDAGLSMVRYADDLVVLCRSREHAQHALNLLTEWMGPKGLELHPEKTRIVDLHEDGFDFLGYHFQAGKPGLPRIVRWPRKQSMKQLRQHLKPLTKRANGRSLAKLITLLNPKLSGWFAYYQHSHRSTFEEVDGWVRARLRALLRKRKGLRGRSRGADHQRWPNTFFHEQGLFSLTAAFDSAIRPSLR